MSGPAQQQPLAPAQRPFAPFQPGIVLAPQGGQPVSAEQALNEGDIMNQGINLVTQLMAGIAGGGAVRSQMPQSLSQRAGLNLQNPQQNFQRDQTATTNMNTLDAINNINTVNDALRRLDPQGFDLNEQALEQLELSTPQVVAAMNVRSSLYEGIPDDFMTKRLRIALQRRRENDLYAFV